MDGSVNFIGSLSGSINEGGGGGGGIIDVQVNTTQVPDYESVVENDVAKIDLYPYMEKSETQTLFDLLNDEIELVDGKVGALEQIVPYKQDKLTAGNNITIENNVISASGGSSWNYSTNEVYTGQNWIDGKPIYCRVIDLGSLKNFAIGWNNLMIPHNNYYDTIIQGFAIYPSAYTQACGLACNDTTYLELCCYYTMSAQQILIYYTKQ